MQHGSDETRYWMAFHRTRHVGPVRIQRLVERFGTLGAAWNAQPQHLRGVLDERALASVAEVRRTLDLDREMERCSAAGVRVLALPDPDYPKQLRQVPAPPPVIYVKGTLGPADERAVGIVGTRRATPYGREVTTEVASGLAAAGVTVVSGLARGIDAVAHQAALDVGGRTIAVLGCGPDVVYPSEHRHLAARIEAQGCLLSEYPPGRQPEAQFFPARNRIISGLSLGIVIAEAPERSGALITADFAADHGRDVFVIPGSVLATAAAGGMRLLRDGARPVRSADDVLDDLGLSRGAEVRAVQAELTVGADERRVLDALTREPQHVDDIAALTGLPSSAVSSSLLMLELKGAARNAGSLHYARA